jgi:hypothetical protein
MQGSNPPSNSLVIANAGAGIFGWSASANQTWLTLSTTNGSGGTPTTVQIVPNAASLPAGDYTAQITVTADNAANSFRVIHVSLRVDPVQSLIGEIEPNDTSSTAFTLPTGLLAPVTAHISSFSDIDWYRFSAIAGQRYIFETYNVSPQLNTLLQLYGTDGVTEIAGNISGGTGNNLSRIAWQAASTGNYYVRVSRISGAGSYSIRAIAKFDEGAIWDGFHEPNDNWETAHSIGVERINAIYTTIYPRGAYSTNSGDDDWFRFSAVLGRRYVIETYNVAPFLNTYLALYDTNGTSQIDNDIGSGTGNSEARIVWQAPQTGLFFIRVNAQSNLESGSYSLRVLPKYDEGASWDLSWEPNDEWVTATPVILNQTQNRSLYERSNYRTNSADNDYFWFYAQAGYQYTFTLQSVASTLRANLSIHSLDGETTLASNASFTDPGTPKSLNYTFATPGNYYVRVHPYSSSSYDYGDYQLRVSSVVPAVQVNLESISLVGSLGSTSTQRKLLTISNSGTSSFSWAITSDQSWLQVSIPNGTTPPNTNIEVWANMAGLPLGTHIAKLTITAPGVDNSPFVIPVTLSVNQFNYVHLPLVRR